MALDFKKYNKQERFSCIIFDRRQARKVQMALNLAGEDDYVIRSYSDGLEQWIKDLFPEADRRKAVFVSRFSEEDAKEIIQMAQMDAETEETLKEEKRLLEEE